VSLALLIDRPDVIRNVWPTEPVLSRRDPAEFEGLLTLQEVNDWIDTGCLAMRNVSILKDGIPVDPRAFEDPDQPDMPQRGYLRRHLTEGGTLSVRSLERLKPTVAKLYATLERELGYTIHVNAYLTPGNCQGLHYHYDPYVTAILQVSGSKEWPIHRPFVMDPTIEWGGFKQRRFTSSEMQYLADTPPDMTFRLVPGDAFWLPRGYIHAPHTIGAEPSLHLTVAVKERTRHWFLRQMFDQIADGSLSDPTMRATVPPRDVADGTEAYVEELRRIALGALSTLDVPRTARAIRRACGSAALG
jgi:ribosomal protein L16 Arg81 hydroxylase